MLPYFVAYTLMFVINALLHAGNFKEKSKFYVIFFFVVWAGLLALRHPSMGIDLGYGNDLGYLASYHYIGTFSPLDLLSNRIFNYEIGYSLFNRLLNYISSDDRLLLIVCAVATIGSAAFFIYRNSPHVFLSSVIYLGLPCFILSFSGLRQILAISVTIVSFEFIKTRKFPPFLVLVLLAASFHKSALVFLLAYPMFWLKTGRDVKLLSVALPVFFWLFRNPLYSLLTALSGYSYERTETGAGTLFLVFWAIYAYTIFFSSMGDGVENGTRNLFFVAVLVQSMSGISSNITRIGYYFMFYSVLLLPVIVNNHFSRKDTSSRNICLLMYILIIICFGAQGILQLKGTTWAAANPYRFFWN